MKPLRALFTSAALAAACALGAGSTASAAIPIATATPTTPVRVAVVLPLTVPATEGSFVGAEALATYTSPTGALTRELDQVIDTPVTLAIDPMLIASIRKLGTSAPDSAIAWLDRLALATNETFPLQYADADLTLALQAGEETVLGTKSLEFAGENPDAVREIVPEFSGLSAEQAEGITLCTFRPDLPEASIDLFAKYTLEYGIIKNEVSYDDLVWSEVPR